MKMVVSTGARGVGVGRQRGHLGLRRGLRSQAPDTSGDGVVLASGLLCSEVELTFQTCRARPKIVGRLISPAAGSDKLVR